MNKDVIYIEPEDDITDIISALELTKEKIVAIVPPKKNGVLRSAVNIKLIAKNGAAKGKKIVLVTTDPATLKLAAAAKLPVTKNLQSAPAIPKLEDIEEEVIEEEVIEAPEEPEEIEEEVEEEVEETEEEAAISDTIKEAKAAKKKKAAEAEEKEAKTKEKSKKDKKEPTNPALKWINDNKKFVIAGCSAFGALIIFLIWAFVIAPSVKITVSVRTDKNNFSEVVAFSTDQIKESSEDGIFYLEEIKTEKEQKLDITATGTKNIGDKARGYVVVTTLFKDKDDSDLAINSGFAFTTTSGQTYYTDQDVSLTWTGDESVCENTGRLLRDGGCLKSTTVAVTAAEGGTKYNINASSSWNTYPGFTVYSDAPITGGTDKQIKVVTKEDIEKAKEKFTENKEKESAAKEALLVNVADDRIIIDASFKQVISDPEPTPAIDEEVTDGTVPYVKFKTTTLIYVIDETKVKEFITNKAKVAEDQKIYSINNPFIENFTGNNDGFSGKLKVSYMTGSKITENDILEISKGRGLGDIQHDIKSKFGNISNINIETSFPWVNSAPGDSNKITIELITEE